MAKPRRSSVWSPGSRCLPDPRRQAEWEAGEEPDLSPRAPSRPPVLGDGEEPAFECFSPAEALDAWKHCLPWDKSHPQASPGLSQGLSHTFLSSKLLRAPEPSAQFLELTGTWGGGGRQGILTTTCPTMSQGPAPARPGPAGPPARPLARAAILRKKEELFL